MEGVVGSAGEEQAVGVGLAARSPGGVVVHFAVVAGFGAAGSCAAAIAGVADDALVG